VTAAHPLHEVDVDEPLVRALLASQHPDLAGLALAHAAAGWDNVTFRLGDRLAVRLPARAAAAPLVEHEQRWLATLAPLLDVPVPVPVRVGRPGAGYPWSWSVVPWLTGHPSDEEAPATRDAWAPQLARSLAALHRTAPAGAPTNPFRGVPLAARDAAVAPRLAAHPHRVVLEAAWRDGLAASPWARPAVWLHGDPHPANLLAADGRLAGILDFGDVTAGDPASDLGTVWATFTTAGRARFWEAYAAASPLPADEAAALRVRARAWAAALAPMYAAHPEQHPGLAAAGAHALRELSSGGPV
jgi:aminoglycoside phosphotransferase (APT) family kinase protein